MQKAFIFDLDGTLVDSLQGISASLNRALARQGLSTYSDAEIRGFIGNGAKMLVTRALSRQKRSLVHQESVIRFFSEDYARSWDEGTFPFEGISDLLNELATQKALLAVLSNKPDSFTKAIIERLFPQVPFAVVLGNREGMPHKPDPTAAQELSMILGISLEKCVLIGDSKIDLDTAKNAGMISVAVTWGYQERSQLLKADYIADDLLILREILYSLS